MDLHASTVLLPRARRLRRTLGAILTLALIATTLILPAAPVAAGTTLGQTWYVDKATGDDATGDGSEGNPFESITAAEMTASAGDTIYVAEGTYTGGTAPPISAALIPGEEDFPIQPQDGMQIIATGAKANTIIDGAGNFRIFSLGKRQDVLIQGFTIQNGYAFDGGAAWLDSGSRVKFKDCDFVGNNADMVGGAISVRFGSVLDLVDCRFRDNGWGENDIEVESVPRLIAGVSGTMTADPDYGGAVFADESTVTISGTLFHNNTARYAGGAVYVEESYLSVTGSTVTSNAVETEAEFMIDLFGGAATSIAAIEEDATPPPKGKYYWTGGTGGGIAAAYNSTAYFADSMFNENKAYWTGGVFADSTSIYDMVDCTVQTNWGSHAGGGVAQHPFLDPGKMGPEVAPPGLDGVQAVQETGGFLLAEGGGFGFPSAEGTSTVKRTLFFRNESPAGSALTADHHDLAVENCVFAGNDSASEYRIADAVMIVLAADATVHSSTFVRNLGLRANIRAVDTHMAPYPATCDVQNTIFWESDLVETVPDPGLSAITGPPKMPPPADTESCTVSYSDTPNGDINFPPGPGNIAADPLFADPDTGDFKLTSGSPCIDTGTPMDAPDHDFDKAPRPMLEGFDMGAFEFQTDIEPGSERLWGDNRFATAVEISQEHFDSADYVVLARGNVFADGLSAAGVAGLYDAPILLTMSTGLPGVVADELERLGARTVILMGGQTAISGAVADELRALGYLVQRIGGADRYETAALAARRIWANTGDNPTPVTFVARGDLFADALAVSPIAYNLMAPILLVEPTSLPDATVDVLLDAPAVDTIIVGGKAAVSAHVTKQLAPGASATERVSGADRYATAVAIADHAANEGWSSYNLTGIATGVEFADALTGGAAIGSDAGVLLLTDPNDLSTATADALTANKADIIRVEVLGGGSAIAPSVMTAALAIAP